MQHDQLNNLLKKKKFDEIETKLRDIIRDPVGKDTLWRLLDSNFRTLDDEKIFQYWWKEYRLYTELSWDRLRILHSDFVSQVVFTKQLVIACILGFDPINELLWYLGLRFSDRSDSASEYTKIRGGVFNSQIKVGVYKNQPYTVAQLVDEIKRLNIQGNPSLEVAELKAKIQDIFFSEMPDPSYTDRLLIDKNIVVDNFFAFIHFLIGVEPDKVFSLAEIVMNGDQYQKELENNEEIGKSEGEVSTENLKTVPTAAEHYFLSIKKIIDGYFAEGKITDETEVFDYLEKFSTEYNDPRILDLYYYDEQSGKFVWNEELLNSSEQESQ